MRKLLLALIALLYLQVANAKEEVVAPQLSANFDSHLHSAMIVSPAQIYAVQGLQTDLTLGYRKSDHETIIDGGKWDFEWMSSILNLTAVTNLPVSGLNLGLNISAMMSAPDEIVKGEGIPELLRTNTQRAHTKYIDISALQISPLVSYHLKDMISLGLRFNYQYIDREYAAGRMFQGEALHTSSSSYSITPAFTVTAADFEAGVAWQTAESGADVEVPAILTMHGRYALDAGLNLGGIYQLKRYSAMLPNHEDQSVLRAAVEWKGERLRIEGNLAYATSFYENEANITAHNISTLSGHTAIDYRITDNAIAGATAGYTFGKETVDSTADRQATEYNMQEMDFALRGNYFF